MELSELDSSCSVELLLIELELLLFSLEDIRSVLSLEIDVEELVELVETVEDVSDTSVELEELVELVLLKNVELDDNEELLLNEELSDDIV